MLPRFGWTIYSLAMLAVAPHGFFARLAQLGWYGDMLRNWADGLDLPPSGRVLEVGCSAGTLSNHLERRGYHVTGVDRSARAIRRARAEYTAGTAGPAFVRGDANDLPFAAASFDAALAASLLNIVPEPQRVVAEMARVATPGGIVSCLFPTPRMNAVTARRFIERHGLTGFSAQALTLWATLARKLEPEAAERLLAAEQLTNIATTYCLDGMVCAVFGRGLNA